MKLENLSDEALLDLSQANGDISGLTDQTLEELDLWSKAEAPKPTLRDVNPISPLKASAYGAADSMSWGFDEEIAGTVNYGMKKAKSLFGGPDTTLDAEIDSIRDRKKQAADEQPLAYYGANIAAGIATPGIAGKAKSIGGSIAKGAGIGAAQGGVAGFGGSDAEDWQGKFEDAGRGAMFGAPLGAAGGALAKSSEIYKAGKAGMAGIGDAKDAALRGYAEGASSVSDDIGILGKPIKAAKGLRGAAREILETKRARSELGEASAQPWPGFSDDWSDGSVMSAKALAGGDTQAVDYITNQARAFGIDADQYKELLRMSPERLAEVATFSKREAAEDAAPLFQALRDTFESVRTNRLKELKGKARQEFSSDPSPVINAMQKAHADAGELRTTAGAQNVISDAYDILRNGKGSETFGFTAGHIDEVDAGGVFDRLQAARSHIDDNIDWNAIKKGNRSPTPVEKNLMRVRESLDGALKGGSPAKIESDALFRKSKELEERFFKLAQDKDGVHEVSLAKLFGDNDRAVKAKQFLTEVEEFAQRPDLPDSMRQSTKALVDNLRDSMQTAGDKRLYQSFSQKTRGPSGPSIERQSAILGGQDNPAAQAIFSPGSFLDLKSQAAAIAKSTFGKNYSELNRFEQKAMVDFLTWQRSQTAAQKAISPQKSAAVWEGILTQSGLKGPKAGGSGDGPPPGSSFQGRSQSELGSIVKDAFQSFAINKARSEAINQGAKALGVEEGTNTFEPYKRDFEAYLEEKHGFSPAQAKFAVSLLPNSPLELGGMISKMPRNIVKKEKYKPTDFKANDSATVDDQVRAINKYKSLAYKDLQSACQPHGS